MVIREDNVWVLTMMDYRQARRHFICPLKTLEEI